MGAAAWLLSAVVALHASQPACGQALVAPPRVGDTWGVNVHFTSRTLVPGELAYLARAFKVVRTGLDWRYIESTCGVYSFGATHALLSLLRAAGVRALLSMGGSNEACYPSVGPSACDTAACVAGFARFAAAAVAEFRGTGLRWESPNEPNGMGHLNATALAALVLAAAPAFAGEAFVGPAASEMDWPYLRAAFAGGVLGAYSAVTVHPYRRGPPESILGDYATLRALIDEFAPRSKPAPPVWSGEWGWTTAGAACDYACVATEEQQAQWVVRSWLVNAASGVALSVAYDWRDDGPDANVCEERFGAVRMAPTGNATRPYVPKPLYSAAAAVQAAVGGAAETAGRVAAAAPPGGDATSGDVFVVAFVGGDVGAAGAAFAVWSNASAPTTATFDAASPATPGVPRDACFALVDWMGAPAVPQRVCAVGGVLTVNASGSPLYVLDAAR